MHSDTFLAWHAREVCMCYFLWVLIVNFFCVGQVEWTKCVWTKKRYVIYNQSKQRKCNLQPIKATKMWFTTNQIKETRSSTNQSNKMWSTASHSNETWFMTNRSNEIWSTTTHSNQKWPTANHSNETRFTTNQIKGTWSTTSYSNKAWSTANQSEASLLTFLGRVRHACTLNVKPQPVSEVQCKACIWEKS